MLTIESLALRLPGFALGPIDLSVRSGEHFVLLGPSGAGKTTLLECVAGFRQQDVGSLTIDGRDSTSLPPRQRALAVVYQQPSLFPHLRVIDNLGFALRLADWPQARRFARVRELARMLHLEHRLQAWPAELSHGEARRAALGRALAVGRRLLLLDEPLEGLDPPLRRQLRLEIVALQRRLELTVVQVTHHLDEAMAMADRVGVMLDGHIAQIDTPTKLLEDPVSMAVARVLMVPNFVEGEADPAAGVLRLDDGSRLPAPVDRAGRVRARFVGARLADEHGEQVGPVVWLRGIERRAGQHRAIVALHEEARRDELQLEAELRPSDADLRAGQRLRLDFSEARWTVH